MESWEEKPFGPYQLYMNTSAMPETDNFRESPAMTGELVVTSGLTEALHLSSFFVQDHRQLCKISMVKSCMNIWGLISFAFEWVVIYC